MSSVSLSQLAWVFLKLGTIGFGGPAAHIALMEEEVVVRRQWLTRSQFLDLLGATNLIPGPNSTEMAIHVGYLTRGWRGMLVTGGCFIVPAVTITAFFAWIYVKFGSLPQIVPFLYGIKPAVLAIILGALWRLAQKAVTNRRLFLIGLIVIAFLGLGLNEVLALLLGGVLGMVWLNVRPFPTTSAMLMGGIAVKTATVTAKTAPITPSLWQLGLFFLKIGSVLFGSGYVLVAFLEGEVVDRYGWLTSQQLLDAIAIGQFTPGPVSSTATFIGYVILGIPGAIVATMGIFLPSFAFVAAVNPLIPKLRQSKWTAAFLDAINVSATALMAVVTLQLGQATLLQSRGNFPFDPIAIIIAIAATILVIRFRVNAVWIVLGSGIIGILVG